MAQQNSMSNFDKPVRSPENPDLALPDWTGTDHITPRLTAKEALLRNDEYFALYCRELSPERIEIEHQVEFSL